MGLKKGEERQAVDLLADVSTPPTEKLRVKESFLNARAERLGIRVHINMEVPGGSVAMRAYNDALALEAVEDLALWRTSSGTIGEGVVVVEAVRRGHDLWCLLVFDGRTSGPRPRRRGTSTRTEGDVQPRPLWNGSGD